jgi:DNA (cytosine-5)-methyltransferase 1
MINNNLKYYLDDVINASSQNLFNVVSLFAGGGGSSTGYRLAGGNVLAINEFVEAAQETYKANYPETYIFKEDVRSLTGKMILDKIGLNKGELDILDGSPPCASFSSAGAKDKMWGQVKKYSDTEQRTDDLFFEFARILNEIQPKVFICENVAGLVTGASAKLLGNEQFNLFGGDENTIFHSLVNCGYSVRYKVINAKNYGVPQNRERTIFIGVRNDIKCNITFPEKQSKMLTIGDVLDDVEYIEMKRIAFGESKPRRVESNNVCFTVTADGLGATRRYKVIRKNNDSTRLTIEELKVLSSFPIDYKLTGSYRKQWERIGRAVPPLMMKAIAEHVYKTILYENLPNL